MAITEEHLRRIIGEMLKNFEHRFEQIDARFEKMDARFEKMDARFEKMEKRMEAMNGTLLTVLGNQNNESLAIEFELGELIRSHLRTAFPHHESRDFPMKRVAHPTQPSRLLTDLDAAFVLHEWRPSTLDDERMRRVSKLLSSAPSEVPRLPSYFVLVEAKHLITRAKIARKLRQAVTMVCMWHDYRAAAILPSAEAAVKAGFSRTLYNTAKTLRLSRPEVHFDPLHHFRVFIGGALWAPGLLEPFQAALEEERPEEISKLERTWMTLPKDEDDGLDTFVERYFAARWGGSILPHVRLVMPSGVRYRVTDRSPTVPEPAPAGLLRGGRRPKSGRDR
jgi:hypothetical protein